MKTMRTNRFVAFVLCLVMLLPMVTIPSFAKSTGGIAYPEDAVWFEDFESATTITDVASTEAVDATVGASLTDAANKVFSFPIAAKAPAPYYLYKDTGTAPAVITDYTIDAATGKLTGKATLNSRSYEVTGVINSNDTSTVATVLSCSGTPEKVYIVTGELADAKRGFLGNVARPVTFQNPAWKNSEVDDFVIDMKLYLSADAYGVIATQISGVKLEDGQTRRMQPFKLSANGSGASLGVGDNGEFTHGGAMTLALGRWHKITIVIDKETSAMDIYANGVHAFTTEMKVSNNNYTKVDGPVDIVKNTFLVQYNRSTVPSKLKGTLQVDDIAFYPSYKASVWSESFENATKLADVATTSAVDATVGASLTDEGDRVFSFPVKGTAPAPYYLYVSEGSKVAFTSYSIDEATGMLTGTATLSGVTYNVTGVINTDGTTTAATVNSCSGTATKVYVVTGEVADGLGGFLGNVARPVYFNHPAWKNADVEDFVIDMDFYMTEGAKGNFATQIASTTVAGGLTRNIQPFLIKATGGAFATLTVNSNGHIAAGAETKIKTGVWNRITIVIDKETSLASTYINGVFALTQEGNTNRTDSYQKIGEPVNIAKDSFLIQYNRGSKPSQLKGTIQVDDLAFYNSVQGLDLSMYGIDFEAYSDLIGQRPTANEGFPTTPNTAVFAKDPVDSRQHRCEGGGQRKRRSCKQIRLRIQWRRCLRAKVRSHCER